jgi:16S rRNA C1402 (ribose-2'-O) methylase RsmI
MVVLGQRSAAGNPGSERLFRGFLPRKTTPRDLYQATVIAKLL